MEEYTSVRGRSTEDIKEFTKERITQWLMDNLPKEFTPERNIPLQALGYIANNKMLSKECAKWLEELLEEELDSRLGNGPVPTYSSKILWVDELSIYADAWGLYCRPGTYHI